MEFKQQYAAYQQAIEQYLEGIIKRLSDDPYQSTTDLRNVHKVSNVEKVVPREWITENGTYATDEFISYVRPLIQGDVSPVMVDGIPRYLYHKKK